MYSNMIRRLTGKNSGVDIPCDVFGNFSRMLLHLVAARAYCNKERHQNRNEKEFVLVVWLL